MRIEDNNSDSIYLGDGAYATFQFGECELWTDRGAEGRHYVVLDFKMIERLYAEALERVQPIPRAT